MTLRISDTEITGDTISNVAHKVGEGRVIAFTPKLTVSDDGPCRCWS